MNPAMEAYGTVMRNAHLAISGQDCKAAHLLAADNYKMTALVCVQALVAQQIRSLREILY